MRKRIFFIWAGDVIPDYVYWTIENYKIINDDWDINTIFISNDMIKNYKDTNDINLIDSINHCIKNYGEKFHATKISAYYRTKILTELYDTYVDFDTFPISNLNNFVVSNPNFYPDKKPTNKRFGYHCDWKSSDIWFISNTNRSYCSILNISKNINMNEHIIYYKYTYMNKTEVEIYNERCEKFFQCKLNLDDTFCCNRFTPIEHYNLKHKDINSKYYCPENDNIIKGIKP